ncbi:MAG: hypothetical protein WA854_04920, partial [Candidatus Binataceae bacterium]
PEPQAKDLREAISATNPGSAHESLRGDPSLRQPPFRMTDKGCDVYRNPLVQGEVIYFALHHPAKLAS